MNHTIEWLRERRVLLVDCFGHQTADTLLACLNDQLPYLDSVDHPIMLIVDWSKVEETDLHILTKSAGHPAYSHPMVARAINVGMNRIDAFQNEIAAAKSKEISHTKYVHTMDDALEFVRSYLDDDQPTGAN